jgi:hypothetical protein
LTLEDLVDDTRQPQLPVDDLVEREQHDDDDDDDGRQDEREEH